ncbi:MAG: 50S ribosomal protein L32 [Candidatus Poribacteria bacterium]|nr:50S ribosomal protein L32 [Candidatus Poribacteria bacterium]
MAHPKHRMSQSKTRMRRAHDFLTPSNLINCANCGHKVRPHRACRACGYFKAHKWHRPVLTVDVD